jgi:hypothetical protein
MAYRLSAFCRNLMKPEARAAFKANEDMENTPPRV